MLLLGDESTLKTAKSNKCYARMSKNQKPNIEFYTCRILVDHYPRSLLLIFRVYKLDTFVWFLFPGCKLAPIKVSYMIEMSNMM